MLLRLQNLQLRVSVHSLETGLSFLVGVPPPGRVRCGEELQLLHLQSFAEVTQWRLLYSVCLSAAVWAAGKEAAEKCDYVYSTCYGALSLESFEKTRVEYKSLTSHLYLLQSFNTAFKAKHFHFTGIWSCQVWSLVFSFACQSQNAFPASALLSLLFEVESRKVLWKLYLWDANKRSRTVSLCPKLSVTSNENVGVWNK